MVRPGLEPVLDLYWNRLCKRDSFSSVSASEIVDIAFDREDREGGSALNVGDAAALRFFDSNSVEGESGHKLRIREFKHTR